MQEMKGSRIYRGRVWVTLLFFGIAMLAGFCIADAILTTFYLLFSTLVFLVLMVIPSRRISWFYAFFAVFFVLGTWLKISFHHIFEYDYIEPIGQFSSDVDGWISYYATVCVMAASLLAARGCSLVTANSCLPPGPLISKAIQRHQWVFLIAGAGLFFAINNYFAFLVIGVHTRLILPLSLNAPLAFMAQIGVALVCAIYVSEDVLARKRLTLGTAFAVLVICLFASISMASRASIVMQGLPILIGAMYLQHTIGLHSLSVKPLVLFAIFLLLVLALVSIYRIGLFSEGAEVNTGSLAAYAGESAKLFIDRWIGAEAIMVAVSEPTASLPLFVKLLSESPLKGVDAIYQALAESPYVEIKGLTFLTLPGYFGVLGLSGSFIFIFFGILVIVLSGIELERMFSALLSQRIVPVVLVCAAMANQITQMSFPVLLVPFLIQLFGLAFFLRYLFRRQGNK